MDHDKFLGDARYGAAARVLDELFEHGIVAVIGAGRRPDDKRVCSRRYSTGDFCEVPAYLRARWDEYQVEIAALVTGTVMVFSPELCVGCRFASWSRQQVNGRCGETLCKRAACDNWLMAKDQNSKPVPSSVGAILDREVDCS